MTEGRGLFAEGAMSRPLAERMRPGNLSEMVGLEEVLGEKGWLSGLVKGGHLPSLIFHGPPGTGKTTLARLLAREVGGVLVEVNAVSTGVAELRQVFSAARSRLDVEGRRTVLFLDEIHRLNKAQQDVLLPVVEDGTVVLIGATTENPYFDVIGPLLSRCRTVAFPPLGKDELGRLLERALGDEERGLGRLGHALSDAARDEIVRLAAGDARVALTLLEEAAQLISGRGHVIEADEVDRVARSPGTAYDRAGDGHYQTVSAFIKSIRGSDPDAAMVWLQKMLVAGEDVRFIARRLVILASEDVGLADPRALSVAMAAAQATEFVGRPECAYALAEATLYLAMAPKSNSAATALHAAHEVVTQAGRLDVPLHLRNLEGRAKGEAGAPDYRYPHDFPGHFVAQEYWPTGLTRWPVYLPGELGEEPRIERNRPGHKKDDA